MLYIEPIPAFTDNYIWVIRHQSEGARSVFVVDPGDANPVIEYLHKKDLNLAGILITHHHPDHVGGVRQLLETFDPNLAVIGPANPDLTLLSRQVGQGDKVEVFGALFSVLEVPGHTLDHIAFYTAATPAPVLFCGDTLFSGGCGRLFEGTPAQMHESLQKLADLPDETAVYCTHEYTLGNLQFALAVEPQNEALNSYLVECQQRRADNLATLPSTIGQERAINPFLRSHQPKVREAVQTHAGAVLSTPTEVFRATREWKDHF